MKQIIYAAFAALVLSLAATAYSDNIENDLETGIIRLHIIANSDSEEDQAVKLKVRDAVLAECSGLLPQEAAAAAAQTANKVLAQNGFDYGAQGEYTKMYFPTKMYGDYTFPAGEYRAVRVILGEGAGHNWWCVLYPPVCMAGEDEISKNARGLLKSSVDKETYELITNGKTVKFKSVEMFYRIKRILSASDH